MRNFDSFEINKFAGAVLGTLLFVFALQGLATLIYGSGELEAHAAGGEAQMAENDGGEAAEATEQMASSGSESGEVVDMEVSFAGVDADKGAKIARQCTACHSFEKGGKALTGPALWGIIGKQIGTAEGFIYSNDLRAEGEAGATWTPAHLFTYLKNPKAMYPGTKMIFAGIRKEDDIKNFIAYLNEQVRDAPVELP